jgi:outer membrane protein OmpA-like peptidoglycan-associated protein
MGMNVADQQRNMEEMNKLVEDLRAKERQAQLRLATFRSMLERFNKMIESGQLKVKIVRGRMVVELSENILFDSGRADLKAEGQAALTEVAGVLSSIQERDFQIAGHTDNVPIKSARFPSNWHLSTARALTVTTYLADHGVPTARLSAAGYADTQPAVANDTAAEPAHRDRAHAEPGRAAGSVTAERPNKLTPAAKRGRADVSAPTAASGCTGRAVCADFSSGRRRKSDVKCVVSEPVAAV